MRVGIDMGGTSVKIGLVNGENEIVGKTSVPTNLDIPYEALMGEISQATKKLVKQQGLSKRDVETMGVGTPGTIDEERGIILYSNNYRWSNVPVVEVLRRDWSCPIAVANDADTAALGETVAGAAKGESNAVLLTLGTGVGSGVIIDRKIFHGVLTGGCELGHMVIEHNGRSCTCGRRGCFEAYASVCALLRQTALAAKEHPESLLYEMCRDDMTRIHGSVPFQAAQAGDEAAQRVLDEYFQYLSCGIANIINIFRPSKIILGGGIAAQGEHLTAPLQTLVNHMCFGGNVRQIAQIVTSKLGNDAGMLGAANLI